MKSGAIVFHGYGASDGRATGLAIHLEDGPDPQGLATADGAALRKAIASAVEELARLAEAQTSGFAAIIEFQIAVLNDPELAPLPDDGAGSVFNEWSARFRAEIDAQRSAPDLALAARAADLEDAYFRVLSRLADQSRFVREVPEDSVVVGRDLSPSLFLAARWGRNTGIALSEGSRYGHLAMLARAQGVPMLVGLGGGVLVVEGIVSIDASAGTLVAGGPAVVSHIRGEAGLERNGTAFDGRLSLYASINTPGDFEHLKAADYAGVGLVRCEFLFPDARLMPDEDMQTAVYREILCLAQGRVVTFRTFDIGDDKQLAHAAGPAIAASPPIGRGLRGVLEDEAGFRTQCRALLRAAAGGGRIRIMFPMVRTPQEFSRARAILRAEGRRLGIASTDAIAVGMMVETAQTAGTLESYDADFYCIGTNDLTCSVYGMPRSMNLDMTGRDPTLARLFDVIGRVAAEAARQGVELMVCGELPEDPSRQKALLDAGVRHVCLAARHVRAMRPPGAAA